MEPTSIRLVADRLLGRLDLRGVPVDVDAVATTLGITLVREPLDAEVSAVLVLAPAGPAICLNAAQPAQRQRLVLAHQIGHLQLRHALPRGEHVHVDTRFEAYRDVRHLRAADRREFEANVFAGTLVMPTAPLRAAVTGLGGSPLADDDIQQLATRFGVSLQGMTLRLSRIGLL